MTLEQEEIAQNMYEKYDFGHGVIVAAHDGWESDGTLDFIRRVYVEFDDAPSESSHTVSFHVKFKKETPLQVEDVYGLLVSNGSEIGHLPDPKPKAKKRSI